MSRYLIFGSRAFAPLAVVKQDIIDQNDIDEIVAAGVSGVANVAREAATELGLICRDIPISTSRDELIETARDMGTTTIVYAARDPETKEITEGTAALIDLLTPVAHLDVRYSPLTAVQALAYHRLEAELAKLRETPERRRGYREKRVIEAGAVLWQCHDALYQWLDANDTDPMTLREIRRQYLENDVQPIPLDGEMTAWLRNLHRYQLISQLLNDAKNALPSLESAA